MEVVIQLKEATENSLDILNDPQSSWKYVENMYYMNIQLSPLSLNPFFLDKSHVKFVIVQYMYTSSGHYKSIDQSTDYALHCQASN